MRALADTSGLLALSRTKDQHHRRAVDVAERHIANGGRFVGTTLILSELYSHLVYLRGVKEARAALARLLDDPAHEWKEVAADLVQDAMNRWLVRFSDQQFSLVDAVSFEVMRREKVSHAFAFDHHFEVAGFRPLHEDDHD